MALSYTSTNDMSNIYARVWEQYQQNMTGSIFTTDRLNDILDRYTRNDANQELWESQPIPPQPERVQYTTAEPIAQYTMIDTRRLEELELAKREVEVLRAKLAQYEASVTPGLRFVQKQQAEKSCD